MRTTLDIDENALEAARRVDPGMTKTALVNAALREYAQRRRLKGLLAFEGKVRWEGDLDTLRRRTGRRRARAAHARPRK